MAHAADLEPTFALAEENAFAAVSLAAEEHEFQEVEFVESFVGGGHGHGVRRFLFLR